MLHQPRNLVLDETIYKHKSYYKNKAVFDEVTNFIIEAKDWAEQENPDLEKLGGPDLLKLN